MKKTILCLALICISTSTVHGADVSTLCGDDTWATFEDEKCVKLIYIFTTRDKAEEICNQQGSKLVTIRSAAEQKFLSQYILNLFESDNVWIGAQRRLNKSTEFEWNDGSALQRYTNWGTDRPTNDVKKSCVQMLSESSTQTDMKWGDVSCGKSNLFVCQKLQTWPIQRIQQAILDARREKEHMTDLLTNVINQLNIANIERKNLQDNPIPLGFVYVQLQNQPEPRTLWAKVTWSEITASYAGLFFRAVGGGSEAFGSIQAENIPRLTGVKANKFMIPAPHASIVATGGVSEIVLSGGDPTSANWVGLSFESIGGEVRPRNTAMRIWIRTA